MDSELNFNKNKMVRFFLIILIAFLIGMAMATEDARIIGISICIVVLAFILVIGFPKIKPINLLSIFLFATAFSWLLYFPVFSITPITLLDFTMAVGLILLLNCNLHGIIPYRPSGYEAAILFLSSFYILGGRLCSIATRSGILQSISICAVPMCAFYVCTSLISSFKQAEKVVLAATISTVSFFLLIDIGLKTGLAEPIAVHSAVGRLAVYVDVWRFRYAIWGNWLGALASMTVPSAFVLFMINNKMNRLAHYYLFVTIICLYYGLRSATLGAVFSMFAGLTLVIILLSTKVKIQIETIISLLILTFFVAFISVVFNIQASVGLYNKFDELLNYGLSVPNFIYRTNLLLEAYSSLLINPIGIGFGTLWTVAKIDEANFFSTFANGTGLLGVLSFWGMCILLVGRFVKTVWSTENRRAAIYAIVGICTIISTFVAAMSSDQILLMPPTSLPFWMIIGATYKSTYFVA